ncbi:unnamed protein product [Penicillium olsonii]|nr:unnamed protein product [Penicillium olsonii]CAG7917092.1 unnamed protein product [Penicillium olsonii]
MPFFAMAHWYAFSWHDYADPTISSARMPVKYALRDAFGVRDLWEDTLMTLRGDHYEYRLFDSGDNIVPHEESGSRVKRVMDGMRYERGGKAKYWIPKPGEVNSRTPLLGGDSRDRGHGGERASQPSRERFRSYSEIEEITMDEEDERLFLNARALEFGDWNYPVITANEVPRDQRLPPARRHHDSNRGSDVKKARRHKKSRAAEGTNRRTSTPSSNPPDRPAPSSPTPGSLQRNPSSTSSGGTRRSQLIDLVVENTEAEEEDRAQIQRTYGTAHVEPEPRRFSYVAQPLARRSRVANLISRRPSGEPIEEEADSATPSSPETNQRSRWNYDLEDNVWNN